MLNEKETKYDTLRREKVMNSKSDKTKKMSWKIVERLKRLKMKWRDEESWKDWKDWRRWRRIDEWNVLKNEKEKNHKWDHIWRIEQNKRKRSGSKTNRKGYILKEGKESSQIWRDWEVKGNKRRKGGLDWCEVKEHMWMN